MCWSFADIVAVASYKMSYIIIEVISDEVVILSGYYKLSMICHHNCYNCSLVMCDCHVSPDGHIGPYGHNN